MATLKLGDIVVVNKLDRLGRSTRELLDLIDRIGKAAASFSDPLWDTSSASRNRRCRNAFPLPARGEKE
jgi:DNA invertase Pin-like site-specific DNA recombinase